MDFKLVLASTEGLKVYDKIGIPHSEKRLWVRLWYWITFREAPYIINHYIIKSINNNEEIIVGEIINVKF